MRGEESRAGEARDLSRRRAELEESVRRRTRRAAGDGELAVRPRPFAEIAELLAGRALVAYLELDGVLCAVTVVEGQTRLHRLQAAPRVAVELDALRFALRRLARQTTPAPSRAAAYTAAQHAANELDRALLVPLTVELEGRPLVVVPTGSLHAMPWSIAPSLLGRPVTVAPSASAWAEAELSRRARGGRLDRITVAAGPGLPFARAEARSVARLYDTTEALVGAAASAASVLARLEGADLAHLAAHGTFRADNPLFSSLSLADGPLTVYDLESLRLPPSLCVLSACESGLSDVRAGDELMGLTAALLALGTTTVIASVVPVPDEPTRSVMRTFHRHLRAGQRPAEALAGIRIDGDDGGSRLVARAGFVCFGAG
jgi:CHAT domain-containing protein